MPERHILIVDDEAAIRELLVDTLQAAGYQCLCAENSQQAHALVVDHQPDLLLLDWMLPGISGLELARRLKRDASTRDIPLLMLTAKQAEDSKVAALESGADDYICKPFSPRELLARIKAVLRRSLPDEQAPLELGAVRLEPASARVFIDGENVPIAPTEYRLLRFFISHPERVYSRSQLLDQVWGANQYLEERTIDVHIRRLRKVLGERAAHLLQTVRGSGYRFSDK